MGIFRGKYLEKGYEPSLVHKLLAPQIKGNDINGLGETAFRRPTPIYHWFGKLKVPHNPLSLILIFYDLFSKAAITYIKKSAEFETKPNDPVTPHKVEKSPEEWSASIKEFGLNNGADLVGIVPMNQDWVFEGFTVTQKWIIVLGLEMDYDELNKIPHMDGTVEVLRVYAHGQETAWNMANWLRQQGWDAKGFCGPDASPVTLIPPALAAGFGELGKHGSIINRELGSNFRLAYVLTDIPLCADAPDDFEADDFCTRCQVCTRECPADAMYPEKKIVRGVEKWYVDFDKCLPYFNDYGGCGICLAVCPWSRPGVAPNLVSKLAKRKAKQASTAIT